MNSSQSYIPNFESQLRLLLQWFREFSEMQRGDFLPVIVHKFGPQRLVNGLIPAMENLSNLDDRPPSLFQCRLKLFNDWTETWSQGEKELLLSQIKSIDPAFSAKFEEEVEMLTSTISGESLED